MKFTIAAFLLTVGSCIHAQIDGKDLPVACIKYCKSKKCECSDKTKMHFSCSSVCKKRHC